MVRMSRRGRLGGRTVLEGGLLMPISPCKSRDHDEQPSPTCVLASILFIGNVDSVCCAIGGNAACAAEAESSSRRATAVIAPKFVQGYRDLLARLPAPLLSHGATVFQLKTSFLDYKRNTNGILGDGIIAAVP